VFSTCASSFKASAALLLFNQKDVVKMENRKRFEIGWKQEAKDNSTLRTQRLLGVIRNIYCRPNHSRSATHFPTNETAKMLKTHELKAAQKKAETIDFLRRRMLTI
jgi:hypothetical protein